MFRSGQELRASWHHRQLDDAELPDRRRVVLKRLWGGSRHLDAARAPESGPSADLDPSPSSYSELLASLRELRATAVDAQNPEHATLLEQLWTLLMPGHPGVPGKPGGRSADDWTKLGFQSAEPAADFRAMGLLALQAFVHFARVHSEDAALIVAAAQSDPTHYPIAITAINASGWLFSMIENRVLSEDHFPSTESLGVKFSGFTVERTHELFANVLLRFNQHWVAAAPESVMAFADVSQQFLEQLWDIAAAGRLMEPLTDGDEPADTAAKAGADDGVTDEDDSAEHLEYQEEIRRMAEATETAIKAAEEAKNEAVMSIFDLNIGEALGMDTSVASTSSAADDANASFGEAIDSTVKEAKAQLGTRLSTFGKKAAEKKEEARKAAAVARATAQHKVQEAEKRARKLSDGAHVLSDRISATASHVAGEAITKVDSFSKRDTGDVSQFTQSKVEVECIWESERRIMQSWRSSYLLPGDFHSWTNRQGRPRIRLTGKPFVSKDDLQIDKSWCWLSEWKPDVVDGYTDSAGFSYAATFSQPLAAWDAEPNPCHYVRRRCWFRLRHPTVPDIPRAPQLPAARAQDIGRVLLDARDLQSKRMKSWFDELDESGSGSLDRNAIESLLIKLGKTWGGQDIDKAVAEMDRSKNGVVDFIDFCDWWQSTASSRPGAAAQSEPEPEPEPDPAQTDASKGQTHTREGHTVIEVDCELVTPSAGATVGTFALLRTGEACFTSAATSRSWSVDDVFEVHRRRYMMQWRGLELMLADRTSVLLNFPSDEDANRRVFEAIREARASPLRRAIFDADSQAAELDRLREAWNAGALSNLEYLMQINTLASRTYSDLSQYPVVPWVLSDYSSASLDLSSPAVF
eukprot:COSAG04_NODE_1879_length_5320_cov_3.323118_6_plen_863_part_01